MKVSSCYFPSKYLCYHFSITRQFTFEAFGKGASLLVELNIVNMIQRLKVKSYGFFISALILIKPMTIHIIKQHTYSRTFFFSRQVHID